MKRTFGLLITLSLLSGCMTVYPLGFNEQDWNALTPAQQLEARKQQAAIDHQKRAQKEAEKKRQARLEQERLELLQARYKEARYGDIIQCVVGKTVLDFKPGWRDVQPVAFTLIRGEKKEVEVHSTDGNKSTSLWVELDNEATNIKFCRYKPQSSYSARKYCTKVAATSRQLHKGIEQKFEAKEYMRGSLFCSLKPMQGQGFDRIKMKRGFQRLIDDLFE